MKHPQELFQLSLVQVFHKYLISNHFTKRKILMINLTTSIIKFNKKILIETEQVHTLILEINLNLEHVDQHKILLLLWLLLLLHSQYKLML
jgi:hypothetical protein